jgi:hypothetical protein
MIYPTGMPNKITLIRQGDVILRSVDEIPKDAEPVVKRTEVGNTVLEPERVAVMGETGHAHVLESVKPYIDRVRGAVYIEVTIPTKLKHEEHPEIEIPPGRYVVYAIQDFVRGRRPVD